jgi:hypothetical protein
MSQKRHQETPQLTRRRTDPGCDKADTRESKSKTPHIQPKLSISTDSLCSQESKTGHAHDCAKHIASSQPYPSRKIAPQTNA